MRHAVARALKDERGVALPVALMMMVMVSGLAVVSAKAAVNVQHQTLRDGNAKRAIQAAAAGMETATYQLNLLQPPATQCVIRTTRRSADAHADRHGRLVCHPDRGHGRWNGVHVPCLSGGADGGERADLLQRRIIATGRKNGFTRRVMVTTAASVRAPLFAASYAAVGHDAIDYRQQHRGGGRPRLERQHRAGTLRAFAAPSRRGRQVPDAQQQRAVCGGFPTSPATVPFNFPPVDQRTRRRSTTTPASARSAVGSNPCTGIVSWNAVTRVLSLNNNATVTLAATSYSFCRIELANSSRLLIATHRAPLKIYIDSPENCGTLLGPARCRSSRTPLSST